MPFLDNLILGRPDSDRRRRHAAGRGVLDNGAGQVGEARPGALFATPPMSQRRQAGEIAGDELGGIDDGRYRGLDAGLSGGREERQRRSCGNPNCGRSWTMPWKSREQPVFDGRWACSRHCLLAMVKTALTRETGDGASADGPEQHHHRLPLGLVMLAQGWITHPELQRALEAQRTHGSGRIGEWLVSECGMKPERVARGLSAQWNCPVLSIEGAWPEAMALAMPRVFLEEYGMVPLRLAGKKILYVGYQDSLDASASFALERMTGLRAESGVLPEDQFTRARETLLRCDFPRQSIASAGDRDGLARAIAETVEHEQPEASRLVRLHRYYWLRVWAKGDLERAAGDLPSHANGVRDYLFTIGRRVARPVHDAVRSQPSAVSKRPVAVEELIDAEAAKVYSGESSPEPEKELTGETALIEREKPVEDLPIVQAEASSGLEATGVTEEVAVREAAAEEEVSVSAAAKIETQSAPELEAYAEVIPQTVALADVAVDRHFLTRREYWFDGDDGGGVAGTPAETYYREAPLDLQRFMRRGFDAEVETIDGEYLPVEAERFEETTLVSGVVSGVGGQPPTWHRSGLLKRLTPSFLDRGPGLGPDPDPGV